MFEIRIYIPLASNEGVTFTQEHHKVFESVLLDRFGGFSRLPGSVVGGWRDNGDGKVYHDFSIVYSVAIPSITVAGSLTKIVAFAKKHYSQLTIYISYLGLSEIL